jgi:hypothetical protein
MKRKGEKSTCSLIGSSFFDPIVMRIVLSDLGETRRQMEQNLAARMAGRRVHGEREFGHSDSVG